MRCAWKELLSILPIWLRQELGPVEKDMLQEIRLRMNAPPELILSGNSRWLSRNITLDDLNFCINAASRYSPWAASTSASGFITASGGHRIGICGQAVYKAGQITGISNISSLCIRVARDFPGIAADLSGRRDSVLILGAPGWGKTTLLRDLIRQRADRGEHIAVIDQRSELFPGEHFLKGKCTDILTGCDKAAGMEMVLRTMGPDCMAVDEITAETDCTGLIQAAWCGVKLLATAHAASMEDFRSRPVYKPLLQSSVFDTIIVLHGDKSWHLERSRQWSTNGSGQ